MNTKNKYLIAWQNFKIILPALLYVAAIIFIIKVLPGKSFVVTLLVILSGSMIAQLITRINNKQSFGFKPVVKSLLTTTLIVSAFYFLIGWLGGYGWLGLVLIVLIYVAYILFRRKKQYMDAVRSVEKQLFGETLDRRDKK